MSTAAPSPGRLLPASRALTTGLAALACLLASVGPAVGQILRLEDVVAGGDGSGNAPPGNTGVDPRTGLFTTTYYNGRLFDSDGVNPSPVPGSPYIDSVFVLQGKVPTAVDGCSGCFVQYITQSGVQLWLDDSEERGSGWNFILKDRAGGISDPGIHVGGVEFGTAIGLHASMGITFDLEALRATHGEAAVGCFSTYWGMDNCAGGFATLLAMVESDVSGVTDLRSRSFGAGQGEPLQIELPRSARYLTLVAASSGPDDCDRATFARPIITPLPCPDPRYSWVWSVSPSRVSPDGELVAFRGEHLDLLSAVRIGGIDVTSLSVFNASSMTGVTPRLAPGFHDLEIVEGFGFAGAVLRIPRAIEVAPPPVLTAISPSDVLQDRPTSIAIQGRNLRSDMRVGVDDVGFDGVLAWVEDLELLGESQMRGRTPREQNGRSADSRFSPDVVLFDQDRQYRFPGLLTYHGAGIERVEPGTVSTGGGTEVTFVGANLRPGLQIDLGGMRVEGLVVLDAGHARGTSPPLPQGAHPAQIVVVDGLQIITLFTLPDAVHAVPPGPLAIASVTPSRVLGLGGTKVTIVTTRSHGGAVPRVGGVPLLNLEVVDELTLRGELPPLWPGFHDVDLVQGVDGPETVIAASPGAIEVVADDQIRIASVVPSLVSTLGGAEVIISGSGFSPGFVPRIGGRALAGVEVTSTTSIRAVTVPLDEGLHDVSIDAGSLVLAALGNAVTAVPPNVPAGLSIGHVRPARISRGTSRVRFVGSELRGDWIPRIGGVPLASVNPVSPCRIEGTAPDLPPGFHRADLFHPGFGVIAAFDELVEVADPGAPPRPAYLVSEPVRRDGSTRVFVFGNDYSANTVVTIGDRPLVDAVVVSDELIVGRAPALDPSEGLGLRDVAATDERGSPRLASGFRYVDPESEGRFVRADANSSGQVDLSDAVFILGYLFLGNPRRIECLDAADPDANGAVDITDAVYILQFLFLGGRPPSAPYPACGLPALSPLGCASFATCGGGGGGGAPTFSSTLKLIEESPAAAADPRVVEIAPEEGEIVIHDPPGGKEVQIGDIIAGFTPVRSDAVHNGVAYMLKVERAIAGDCLVASGDDRVFKVRPASLAETVIDGNLELRQVDLFGARVTRADRVSPVLDCFREIGGGGGRGEQGSGGNGVFFDLDFGAFELLDLRDGDNYLKAGFYQSKVRYNSGVNLGVGIGAGKLTRLTVFAGQLLEADVEFYVDAGLFTRIHKEVKLFHIHKGTVVFIGPVPILVTAAIALYAGVDLEAGVTLFVDAGTSASYKAGIGFDFDGSTIRNISGFEPPRLSPLPDTPVLQVDGFASVKGYIRPEFLLGAGLLIKAVTGDLYMISEVFGRAHVEGHTDPPCFQWGFDAGAKVTVQTEVQLFGYDLFDRTFVLVNEEWPNLLGGEIGCKAAPVARLKSRFESTAAGLLIHLDASESYDPDGGPLTFRWDLNDDGKCRRDTGTDPRTTFVFNPPPGNPCLGAACTHVIRLRVTDDERTYAERTTSFTTVGQQSQLYKSEARLP